MRAAVNHGGRQPGRPRSAQTDQAILAAVVDLLREGSSLGELSIEAVAARARVGKATIYRRWPNKEALVRAAAVSLKPLPPPPRGVSLREDLVALVRAGGLASDDSVFAVVAAVLPALLRGGEVYDLFQSVLEPCREVGREVLRRGIRTGELRADLDIEVALAALVSPMVLHRMMLGSPRFGGVAEAESVVDLVLDGARAT